MKRFLLPAALFLSAHLWAQTPNCHVQIDSVYVNGQNYLNPDTINLCQGSFLLIYSSAYCLDSLFYDDFNSGSLSSGWNTNTSPMFNNPCGPGPDGSTYLWIGPATNFPRELVTQAINVTTQGQVCFDMKYASQANSSPCEGPDEPTEGVHLQWSFDITGPWTGINYWDPVGGYDPYLTNWHQYCENVPVNGTVYFRWHQNVTSGNDYDHWGIDNVRINSPFITTYTIEWNDGISTFSNNNNIIVSPSQNTTYTITLNTTGITIQDQLVVNILDTNLNISGLNSVYYTTSPPVVITGNPQPGYFTGPGIFQPNIFSPMHAGVGTHDITWHHYLLGNNTSSGTINIFEDDFSTDLGWTGYGQGGWERGPAVASTGCSGGQDPSNDHSPTTDNFIIGNYIGACYPNSMTQTYWLTSPVIDCSAISGCALEFFSYSGCESTTYDRMYIEIYNGSSWQGIYSNTGSFAETAWTFRTYPIPQAACNANFKFRFGLGPTDGSVTYSGWNIDDLKLKCTGSVQINDTLCELSYTQQVTVLLNTGIIPDDGVSTVSVFPNPAGNFLNIISENELTGLCTLTDINGKCIIQQTLTGKENKLVLENIPAGVYVLKIGDTEFRIIKK